MNSYLSELATIVGSLGIVLCVLGLIALPINCLATYASLITIKHSRNGVGRVIYPSGPPLTVTKTTQSGPAKTGNNTNHTVMPREHVEVVTRPASQMWATATFITPKPSRSAPDLQQPTPPSPLRYHDVSRNPSFHRALSNPSPTLSSSYDRPYRQSASSWSYDF